MERNAETRERGSREAGEGNGLKKGQIEESLEPKVQNYTSLIQELYKKKDVLLATQNCFFSLIIIIIMIIIIFIIITIKFVLQKTVIRVTIGDHIFYTGISHKNER